MSQRMPYVSLYACGGCAVVFIYVCVCMSAIDVLCLIHVVAFVPRYVYDV